MSKFAKQMKVGRLFGLAILTVIAVQLCPHSGLAATIPSHVLTADYVGGPKDSKSPPSVLAPWLSWAETTWQLNPAIRGAGIKAMYYTNPNRQLPGNSMYTDDETTFAHTCDGSRITSTVYQQQNLMDPNAQTMHEVWKKLIASRSTRIWDAFFDDDANALGGLTGMPCNYSADAWLEATKREIEDANVPIVYNGLQIEDEMKLNQVKNVIGGMYEGCYSNSEKIPKTYGVYWPRIENTELSMARDGKLFFCLGRDSSSAADAIDGRIYNYASFLLTYSINSSVIWESYYTASRFRVEPESELVALHPVVGQPQTVAQLKLRSGVYGREYRDCYIVGLPAGPCAVVVNPDGLAGHEYPYGSKYGHTLVLTGGGVLDGGTLSSNGPAPSEMVPALGAYILFN